MKQPRRMLLNAFHMNCVSHIQHGLWVRTDTRQTEYTQLEPWVELASILEKGCFDALFLADVIGVYDSYRGGAATSIVEGMQIPVNAPALLITAMAYVTEHLGFAYTSSVLQVHPFTFARQVSTLDHLTRGRVAWNVVTSYLQSAGENLGYGALPDHDERYDRAHEYLDVTYKLWEGSWEDGAVQRDTERGVYADPDKVHLIHHQGRFYDVVGPHLSEPSPQRTPLLFQAGSSSRGRDFAAQHAESVFIGTTLDELRSEASIVKDIRRRAAEHGREPNDIKFFQAISPVVGATETEARQKEATFLEQLSAEGELALMSGSYGVDMGAVDLEQPLASFPFQTSRGAIAELIAAAPDGAATFGDLLRLRWSANFLTGAPDQVADALEAWFEAGGDGFNLMYSITPGTFVDFVDGVMPVLQTRGLAQREYAPGPLRQKIFGHARLPERHPASVYRR